MTLPETAITNAASGYHVSNALIPIKRLEEMALATHFYATIMKNYNASKAEILNCIENEFSEDMTNLTTLSNAVDNQASVAAGNESRPAAQTSLGKVKPIVSQLIETAKAMPLADGTDSHYSFYVHYKFKTSQGELVLEKQQGWNVTDAKMFEMIKTAERLRMEDRYRSVIITPVEDFVIYEVGSGHYYVSQFYNNGTFKPVEYSIDKLPDELRCPVEFYNEFLRDFLAGKDIVELNTPTAPDSTSPDGVKEMNDELYYWDNDSLNNISKTEEGKSDEEEEEDDHTTDPLWTDEPVDVKKGKAKTSHKTGKKATSHKATTESSNKTERSYRRPVILYNTETGEKKTWGSCADCAKELGVNRGIVSQVISGKMKSINGLWKVPK